MSDLKKLIIQFIQTQDRNLQFDFYLHNQIILQIYKLYDIKTWGYGIEKQIVSDLVVELTFNKQKFNNENNKRRLLNSDLFHRFYRFDTIKEDSYWIGIDSKQSTELIESQILEIINTVYDLNGENIVFTVNAF